MEGDNHQVINDLIGDEMIEVDLDIQKKGRHFMKLDSIHFDKASGETPTIFYKRLRSFFSDNLRKIADIQRSKNDVALTENEKISPTLENTIVFMALREIDPRLPAHVEKLYGHQMDRHTTLFDKQPDIFQALPKLLIDLDKEASLGSVTASTMMTPQNESQDWF